MQSVVVASSGLSAASIQRLSKPHQRPSRVLCAPAVQQRAARRGAAVAVRAAASDDAPAAAVAVAALGLPANAIMAWSLYTLKTTGAGLPPGPGGALGAAEGISYLLVTGIVGWSLYTKVKTGSGLPAGPGGLIGAAEGISFLSFLAAIAVFGLNAAGI